MLYFAVRRVSRSFPISFRAHIRATYLLVYSCRSDILIATMERLIVTKRDRARAARSSRAILNRVSIECPTYDFILVTHIHAKTLWLNISSHLPKVLLRRREITLHEYTTASPGSPASKFVRVSSGPPSVYETIHLNVNASGNSREKCRELQGRQIFP